MGPYTSMDLTSTAASTSTSTTSGAMPIYHPKTALHIEPLQLRPGEGGRRNSQSDSNNNTPQVRDSLMKLRSEKAKEIMDKVKAARATN
jgi:hypothetical protein